MFFDSIGNYGYFVTRTFPYVTGCFGPGNYPSFLPNCTTNAPSGYTKSKYTTSDSSTVYAMGLHSFNTLIMMNQLMVFLFTTGIFRCKS